MGTLPNSQCHYIITTITGQTEESQVRWGETDAYLMFDNGCKRSTQYWIKLHTIHRNIVGSLCPSFKHPKKLSFLDWDFFNHLAPDMQYETNELFCILNCVCPTIHIHFFMKYKLNGRHTFLSNLWTFSVPYILVVLIFFGEKIYSTCFSLQIST